MPSTSPQWVLLSYRVPREPSTARIKLWRKLRKLGVAQLGDGLVALPLDARTKEHLEWNAAAVVETGGDAMVWVAEPASLAQGDQLVEQLRTARDAEYQALLDETAELIADEVDGRTMARLRRTLRDISRRDYFGAPLAEEARRAVQRLAAPEPERAT